MRKPRRKKSRGFSKKTLVSVVTALRSTITNERFNIGSGTERSGFRDSMAGFPVYTGTVRFMSVTKKNINDFSPNRYPASTFRMNMDSAQSQIENGTPSQTNNPAVAGKQASPLLLFSPSLPLSFSHIRSLSRTFTTTTLIYRS